MELPQGCRITVEDKPSTADRNRLGRELGKHNRRFLRKPDLPKPDWQRLGVFVRDADGNVAAGLAGNTYGGWLFVEDLWVRADLRGRGIGRELLARAEQRARERGCHSAWLDTWSFQAPWFYPKFGYTVFGVLDCPPDNKRFFLQKRLTGKTS